MESIIILTVAPIASGLITGIVSIFCDCRREERLHNYMDEFKTEIKNLLICHEEHLKRTLEEHTQTTQTRVEPFDVQDTPSELGYRHVSSLPRNL